MANHWLKWPSNNLKRVFFGIEVHTPGVGHLLQLTAQTTSQNIKVISDDAIEILKSWQPQSLQAVLLFFPDPWPKKKHHKRRIVNPEFLELVHRVLKTDGFFHAATDWEDYAFWILEHLQQDQRFVNQGNEDGFHTRPETRKLTKFERRGLKKGHAVWDLIYRKTG